MESKMKIAMTLVAVLLCAAVGRADSYTVEEQVWDPNPGFQVLDFFVNGPSVRGDDLVAEILGIQSIPRLLVSGITNPSLAELNLRSRL
jgi:hypothetical protein